MDPQPPIINPSIPFLGYIFGGLSRGRMVIIQGRVQPQAKRFTVALRCAGDDIALQLKCSFLGRPMLVCTAQQGRLWVSDECCAVPRLSPGGVLELIISTQEHGYQVAMNGQHALEFLHRLPLTSVQALEVTGDVTLTCITFTGSNAAAGAGAPALPAPVTPSNTPVIISNPVVPFHMVLSKGPSGLIQPITIVGTVLANANRFHANLWSSASGDLVLHVNPRLREGVLVRNTRQHGSWGPEERQTTGPMPFQRGQPFQLEIRPLSQAFALWVNGRHVCDYSHRLPPATIDQLEVAGDVTLACVTC
ncbi:galectin-4-like [Accipiter gentilis]|uniref:galectin-4-like n=1 Tax=Astur gentilis TaxID=8957 RepID=UPI0021104BAA|nr:galectin-4-like [Accipiter gentilis]